MDKIRILIGLTYYLPNVSGLTRYVSLIATELAKKGFRTKVICSSSEDGAKDKEMIDGVEVNRVSGIRFKKGIVMPSYLFKSRRIVKEADVIWCNLPSLESIFLAFWGWVYKKPLIVTYHCRFCSGNSFVDWLVEKIHEVCCSMARWIVVNSKDYIEGYGLLQNFGGKIKEIYPPIVLGRSNKKTRRSAVVGFLGRISREKNLEILIKAVGWLPKDITLEIAGPMQIAGEEAYKEKIERLIKSDRRVVRLGKIENVTNYLRSISCLVLPSSTTLESFGMVQAEAILCGCPVVASDLPGIRVPISITKGGQLFEPNNVKDLVKKIKSVLNTPPIINIKEVGDIFSYKKTINQYIEIFRGV